MFEVLLESRHVRPPRPVVATALSAGFHTGLIVLLIGGTAVASDPKRVAEIDRMFERIIMKFVLPPDREAGPPAQQANYVLAKPTGSLDGDPRGLSVPVKENAKSGEAVNAMRIAPAVELSSLSALQVAAREVGAYTIVDVDSAAERDPLSAAPAYPQAMLSQNIEGSAIFRFVVDTTGLIKMSSVTLIRATRPEFADAVRDAMPRMRFRPAKMGVNIVPQLSEQPFTFQIRRTEASPGPKKP